MVPPEVLAAAHATHAKLHSLNIPHVFVGGLAVGVYAQPRMTSDVDVLVPRATLEQLGDVSLGGVIEGRTWQEGPIAIDAITVHDALRPIEGDLLVAREVHFDLPIIRLEGLLLLKAIDGRMKDEADIVEVLKRQTEARYQDARRWIRGAVLPRRVKEDVIETLDSLYAIAQAEKARAGRAS